MKNVEHVTEITYLCTKTFFKKTRPDDVGFLQEESHVVGEVVHLAVTGVLEPGASCDAIYVNN